ncbi:MAG TPA: hypothetical protein VF731_11480 [Solirubrobacterales bacterium]
MPLGLVGLDAQPLLLGAQQVDRDRPGVVGVHQLLALLAELGEAAALAGSLGFGLLPHPRHRRGEPGADRFGLGGRDPHLPIGALDGGLDQVDRDMGLLAAGPLLSPDAEEVGVAPAVAVCVGEAHPRAAAPAVERSLEVVMVLSVLLSRAVVGGEDGTGFLEGGAVDQVLVAALVFHPGEADHADVVGVLEDHRQLRA